MPAPRFRDEQWDRVYQILRDLPGLYIRQEAATRRFVETVLWMARAGCAWRLLPEEYGAWNSVYKRFARWQEKGVWQALLDRLSEEADVEWLMLDSTVVRAHACAAGAKKMREIRLLAALEAAFPASCMPPRTHSATRSASI
ncbi:MAG: IS5 family transposase [Alphaproteobacteria bacterium]|nr:IS5 family transposase [Alphaproteobacteria bacterium]